MPSAWDLVKEAWSLFRSRLKPLLTISLLPLIAFFLLGLIVAVFVVFLIMPPYSWPIFLLGTVLLIAVLALISASHLALIYTVSSPETSSVKQSLSLAWKKLLPYWGVSLLSGLIILGGYSFLFVPGFIFAVWFSFAIFIFAQEGLTGLTALTKSRALVRGYFWLVLGRFFLGSLIILLPQIVLSLVLNTKDTKTIASSLNSVLSLVTTPLMTCYSFIIYRHLTQLNPSAGSVPSSKFKIVTSLFAVLGVLLPLITIGLLLFLKINRTPTDLPLI